MPFGYGIYESQGLKPEHIKEFSWVSGRPGDEYVFCKLCKKDITVNGRSSLRAHANGIKHSKLEKAFKRKQKKTSKASSSRPSTSSKPSTSRSTSSGVNNFFINAPNASTIPGIGQAISSSHNPSQRGISSSTSGHRNFVREESPDEILSRAHLELNNFIKMKQEFKESIELMFVSQKSMVETDIADILDRYKRFFSPVSNSAIKLILSKYKSSVEKVRKDIKQELFDFMNKVL